MTLAAQTKRLSLCYLQTETGFQQTSSPFCPRAKPSSRLYEGAFEFEVVSGEDDPQSAHFSLTVLVAAQADIRTAAKAGGAGIDFGVVESGKEENAFVSVRSNNAYAIELESRNGSFLQRKGLLSSYEKIAYSTSFNGFSLLPQVVVRVPESADPTGQNEQLNRLRLRIGNTADKPAGLYEDTVRLTVILLE